MGTLSQHRQLMDRHRDILNQQPHNLLVMDSTPHPNQVTATLPQVILIMGIRVVLQKQLTVVTSQPQVMVLRQLPVTSQVMLSSQQIHLVIMIKQLLCRLDMVPILVTHQATPTLKVSLPNLGMVVSTILLLNMLITDAII